MSSVTNSKGTTTYLITGANRGIGYGLVSTYLSRPNTTVIAAVRDPNKAAEALHSLPKEPSSTLLIHKIDSSSQSDALDAIRILESQHQITAIDTVIANAGICDPESFGPVADLQLRHVREHVDVNALGPLLLFQAVLPLLQRSKQPGKFVTVSSPLGSIGGMEQRPFANSAYGASKAMINYWTRKIHFENEGLIAFPVDPGFVQTDLGNIGARAFGLKEAETPMEESVDGLVKVIDGATREKTSGHFFTFEGVEFPW